MKGPTASTLRGFSSATHTRSVQSSARTFATTLCARDTFVEAESSSARDRPGRLGHAGESQQEVFKRNLRQVQAFRRRRDAVHVKTPFLPPDVASQTKTTPTPLRAALSTLVATGAALGCASSKVDKTFAQFVYGKRSGLSIIDLDQTLPILRRTAALVRDLVKEDGVVLFVGTRQGMQRSLDKAKDRMGDNGYTTARWIPGLLTNSEVMFGIKPLLEKSALPDLVVFLNPSENANAVRECTSRNIPTVGVIDSDTDPRFVTYPIPANAESLRTTELIVGTLSLAGQEGRRLRLKEAEERQKRAVQRKGEEYDEFRRQSARPGRR